MNKKYLVVLAVASAGGLVLVGCGDSSGTGGAGGTGTGSTTTTGSPTTSTGSSSSKSTGTGTATATGTGTGTATATSSTGGNQCAVPNDQNDTCDHACAAAFDCGALICTAPDQLCTGFAPQGTLTKANFDGGCVTQCNANMAFKAAVDPTDCAGTIATLKAASPTIFAPACTPP